ILAFRKQRKIATMPVSINEVVTRTLDLLRRTLPENITVEPTLCEGEKPALADQSQMQQVLMNLCLNARDAMPEGGRLEVRTQVEETAERPWLRLTVSDTGQGMDTATQHRIFEPFFTTKERGSGLGLAVVRQIVDNFGGKLAVHSQVGVG